MHSSRPLVSVIMNCYNSDTYLREAIQSVIDQSYNNWEIVFWDNQSTDESARIVHSYDDSRIKYFYAPEFTPLGKARNLAISQCSGEWVAFLDCDDLWDRSKLQTSFEALAKQEEKTSLIYSRSKVIDKEGKTVSCTKKSPSGKIHDTLLTEGNFIVFSSVIVKKSVLVASGKIDETLNHCEDLDLLLRVLQNGYAAIGIDEPLTSYRVHGGNLSLHNRFNNRVEVMNFLKRYMKENGISGRLRFAVVMSMSYVITSFIAKALLKRQYDNAFAALKSYPVLVMISPLAIAKRVILQEYR